MNDDLKNTGLLAKPFDVKYWLTSLLVLASDFLYSEVAKIATSVFMFLLK